jgi:hypothetical protein
MEMEKVVQRKEEVPMEELIPPSSIFELDVKEWAMELGKTTLSWMNSIFGSKRKKIPQSGIKSRSYMAQQT